MIARLAGVVDAVGEDSAVVDVGGVGYLVYASARTLRSLPPAGAEARIWIETHVREDHIHLYGFADPAERDWFRLLTTVQGVGSRVALGILSALSPDRIADALSARDPAPLTAADGVGPKLAARILNELRDRAGAVLPAAAAAARAPAAGGAAADPVNDAVSALVNLGYRRAEAFGAVARAAREPSAPADLQGLIKAGLKELAP